MCYAGKLFFGIGVVLLGSTMLLSCNNPHATRMDEQASLDLEADIHRRAHNGAPSLLHLAAWRGDAGVVETLLSQIPEADRVALIHQRNNDGDSALHMAVQGDKAAFVHTHLYRKSHINHKKNDE